MEETRAGWRIGSGEEWSNKGVAIFCQINVYLYTGLKFRP